jgi:hypothetical protein
MEMENQFENPTEMPSRKTTIHPQIFTGNSLSFPKEKISKDLFSEDDN